MDTNLNYCKLAVNEDKTLRQVIMFANNIINETPAGYNKPSLFCIALNKLAQRIDTDKPIKRNITGNYYHVEVMNKTATFKIIVNR